MIFFLPFLGNISVYVYSNLNCLLDNYKAYEAQIANAEWHRTAGIQSHLAALGYQPNYSNRKSN